MPCKPVIVREDLDQFDWSCCLQTVTEAIVSTTILNNGYVPAIFLSTSHETP
jgi:hypothetical protein